MNLNDTARFFIIYPLNLEDLGLQELERLMALYFREIPYAVIEKIPGGLLIECPLRVGLLLNLVLRTPTRILLRLAEFKCRDAPKLFNKISKFNWAPWLIGQVPEVESSSVNSRLFDSRKIEKAISDGVKDYYRHRPTKKKYLDHLEKNQDQSLPKIYFRADHDLCTLSLDTTGERLHLRGEKTLSGNAPIRESLAALLLIELKNHLKIEMKNVALIDPMCGSGTFLLEEWAQNKITVNRDFSYQHVPVALDDLQFLKTSIEEKTIDRPEIIGMDQDSGVILQTRENCKGKDILTFNTDLFSDEKPPLSKEEKIVVINPPYGIRVGEHEHIDVSYYLKIIERIKVKFAPKILGIIVPAEHRLKSKKDLNILSVRPFKNGGIEVLFYVLEFK